jgi:hypothetical protein
VPAAPADAPATLAQNTLLWAQLRAAQERITGELNKLRDTLSAIIEVHGYTDERGNLRLELPEPVTFDGRRIESLKYERRVSRVLNEERAAAFAKQRGLTDRLFPPTPLFDEQQLYVLYQEHVITEADIDALYDTREGWAFKPQAVAV